MTALNDRELPVVTAMTVSDDTIVDSGSDRCDSYTDSETAAVTSHIMISVTASVTTSDLSLLDSQTLITMPLSATVVGHSASYIIYYNMFYMCESCVSIIMYGSICRRVLSLP